MLFNVAGLLKSSSGNKQLEIVDSTFDVLWCSDTCSVKGTVLLVRTDSGVWASGNLQISTSLQCGSCLRLFRQSLEIRIEEEYLPYRDLISGAIIELGDYEEAFRIDFDNLIDLTYAVREYSELAMPLAPRCERNCRGICSYCGTDLNRKNCLCTTDDRDLRWGPLLDLLETEKPYKERGLRYATTAEEETFQ